MQALTLLNDPVFFECAEALGKIPRQNNRDDPDAAHRRSLPPLPRTVIPNRPKIDTLRSAHDDFARRERSRTRPDRDGARRPEPRRIHHPRLSLRGSSFPRIFTPAVASFSPRARAGSAPSPSPRCCATTASSRRIADGFKAPHFAPKAKNCIYFFMEGGPSQMDLFDPKPKLNELDGQPLPDVDSRRASHSPSSRRKTARLMGSPRIFKKYGQCGMDLSDLLPASLDLRRRHRPGPLDALRPVQSPPRPAADVHRLAAARLADAGLVAELRTRERLARSARLRRADHPRTRTARRRVELVERLPPVELRRRRSSAARAARC